MVGVGVIVGVLVCVGVTEGVFVISTAKIASNDIFSQPNVCVGVGVAHTVEFTYTIDKSGQLPL